MEQEKIYAEATKIIDQISSFSIKRLSIGEAIFLSTMIIDRGGHRGPVGSFNMTDLKRLRVIRNRLVHH